MTATTNANVTSWFCGVIVPEIFHGVPHVLTVNYYNDPTLRVLGSSFDRKLPGGCSKPGEKPLDTLLREILEEILHTVNGDVSRGNVKYNKADVVCYYDLNDNDHAGGIHRKYFYVVQGLKGPFRSVPKPDDDGIWLSQPIWMPLVHLHSKDPSGGLFRGHERAIPAMMNYLASESREWWNALSDFL
jgi:8-oxo-dGTP pyrophosphatase MutT (NUDIX family)